MCIRDRAYAPGPGSTTPATTERVFHHLEQGMILPFGLHGFKMGLLQSDGGGRSLEERQFLNRRFQDVFGRASQPILQNRRVHLAKISGVDEVLVPGNIQSRWSSQDRPLQIWSHDEHRGGSTVIRAPLSLHLSRQRHHGHHRPQCRRRQLCRHAFTRHARPVSYTHLDVYKRQGVCSNEI